jgi:hypothetical protein
MKGFLKMDALKAILYFVFRTLHIYCKIGEKFGIADLNIMLSSFFIGFRENRRREGRAFLMGGNGITFAGVSQNRVIF